MPELTKPQTRSQAASPASQVHVTKGSGNVFADLGFESDEAANLLVRSSLLAPLQHHIRTTYTSQAAAAEALGETKPRMSNLMNSHVDRFSIDQIVKLLDRAGFAVAVSVTPKSM